MTATLAPASSTSLPGTSPEAVGKSMLTVCIGLVRAREPTTPMTNASSVISATVVPIASGRRKLRTNSMSRTASPFPAGLPTRR